MEPFHQNPAIKRMVAWIVTFLLILPLLSEYSGQYADAAAKKPAIKSSLSLKVGKKATLSITKNGYKVKKATWKSSKPGVLKVKGSKKKAVLTALKKGKAIVTLKLTVKKSGKTKKFTLKSTITVKSEKNAAESTDPTERPYTTESPDATERPNPTEKPDSTEVITYKDPEIERAVKLGITTDDFIKDEVSEVTYQDIYTIMKTIISKKDASKVSEWDNYMKPTDNKACVLGTMLSIYYTDLVLTGLPRQNLHRNSKPWDYSVSTWENVYDNRGDFDSISRTVFPKIYSDELTPLYYSWTVQGRGKAVQGYNNAEYASYELCSCLGSTHSCNRLFDETDDGLDLVLNQPGRIYTHNDLAIVAIRFYDSFSKEDYVDIRTVSGHPVSEEEISTAAPVPDASRHSVSPYLKGSNIGNFLTSVFVCEHRLWDYYEADIPFLAEHGVNYVVLPMTFTMLNYPDFTRGIYDINLGQVEEIDNMVRQGLKYGVHIQFSFTGLPGRGGEVDEATWSSIDEHGCTGYDTAMYDITDEEWEAFRTYVMFLVNRYSNVPTDYISYVLLHEQYAFGSEEFADRLYTEISDIADSIWAVNPDRLVMIAGDDGCYSDNSLEWELFSKLAAHGLGLALHPYNPRTFTHSPDVSFYTGTSRLDVTWPYTDPDGVSWNYEKVYEKYILKVKELADKNNVAFIVNEVGLNNLEIYPESVYIDFYSDMMQVFDKYNIPNAICQIGNIQGIIKDDLSDSWAREGAKATKYTYRGEDYIHTFYYDEELTKVIFGK